jgi:hypothetical protein
VYRAKVVQGINLEIGIDQNGRLIVQDNVVGVHFLEIRRAGTEQSGRVSEENHDWITK